MLAAPLWASAATAERLFDPSPAQPFVIAQGSRDALFGSDKVPAEAPGSRDALFGSDKVPAEAPATRVSGFVESVLAYTYGDPSHWSRAVGRFQLAAQGQFNENVKWKLSGRVDGDLVYAASDFYLDRVKRDQRLDFFFRENYLDFSYGSWALRLGAQQIVWGEVVGLFFADVVSARDWREFLLPAFDVMRIPQWAARAEYFHGDAHVELVWIPVPTVDDIGKPGADFYPVRLPSPTPEAVAEMFRDPERPKRSIGNSNFGIRANTLVSGWDLSAFFYRSFYSHPTFYREPTNDPAQPFVFVPRFDRVTQVGGTVSKDIGDFVLRAETVYTRGLGFTLADFSQPVSVVKRDTFDYIVGVEFGLPRETRVNVQGFQRVVEGGQSAHAIDYGGPGVSLFLSTKLTSTLEPQLLWIHHLKGAGGLFRARLNWTPMQNVAVALGADVFNGPSDGFFGRFSNRDRVYTEVRYSF